MAAFLRLALLCVFTVVLRATDDPLAVAIGHAKAHPLGDVPASFVAEDYRGDLRDLPIGVFDSGVGGLTVLEALKALIERESARRLARLGGSEPELPTAPRRRSEPV